MRTSIGDKIIESENYKEINYAGLVKVRKRLKLHPPAAPLTILRFPDPRLRTVAQPVKQVNEEVRDTADKMLTTMYALAGVGLAATQVNVHKRLIVMDVSDERNHPICLINPEIVDQQGEMTNQEGCLSVPDFYARVTRAAEIKVTALDLDGRPTELEATGLLADCIQHEIDHLNGKLFIDHLTPLKRQRFLTQLKKQQKKTAH